MTGILVIKDKIKNIYIQHELIVSAVLKFLTVFIGLLIIKEDIGYMEKLHEISVMTVVALLSSFLPLGLVILVLAAVIIADIYALSMQLALVCLCIVMVMFVLYYRFTPKESALLILVPMAFCLNVPYAVPLIVGLVGTPVSIVSVAFGTIVYYMINIISNNAVVINNMQAETSTAQIEYFIDLLVKNKEMYFNIFTFLVVIIIVYSIKRMSINNAWTTAITVGGIVGLIMFIVGSLVVPTDDTVFAICVGSIVSVGIAIVLQFCVFSVDYSRTEHTQFEDDDYYYYVKAVPKINITAPAINVKRINAQRTKKNTRKK